jgi:hypothetical protein
MLPLTLALPAFRVVEYVSVDVSPLFQLIELFVVTGLLFLARSAQVSVVVPVDDVVVGELLVIPATLLFVQPERLVVTVSVCMAGVLLTPGEIVAVPVRVHEIVGFDPAAAGPAAARRVMGLMAAIANMTVPSRLFTEITFLVCNATSRVKRRCPPSPDCPPPARAGQCFLAPGDRQTMAPKGQSSSRWA